MKSLQQLYLAIKESPRIQIKGLAEKMNRSVDTLDKQIKKLVESGLIEHRGSKKTGGYWEVLS